VRVSCSNKFVVVLANFGVFLGGHTNVPATGKGNPPVSGSALICGSSTWRLTIQRYINLMTQGRKHLIPRDEGEKGQWNLRTGYLVSDLVDPLINVFHFGNPS